MLLVVTSTFIITACNNASDNSEKTESVAATTATEEPPKEDAAAFQAIDTTKLGSFALAMLAITSLAYVSSCRNSEDDEEESSGTALASPDVNDPLSAVVAVRFTGVPASFPVGSAPQLLPAE